MTSRRNFCLTAGAFGLTPAAGAWAKTRLKPATGIKSLTLRDETIIRNPTMSGDNWHLTWANNDLQYTSMCDGHGNFDRPPYGRYNSRLMAMEGGPRDTKFLDVPASLRSWNQVAPSRQGGRRALDARGAHPGG